MFCKFNHGGKRHEARCSFKDIEERIIDDFIVVNRGAAAGRTARRDPR